MVCCMYCDLNGIAGLKGLEVRAGNTQELPVAGKRGFVDYAVGNATP